MTALTLYPAIDLKDGRCVRLRRGDMDQATVYADDPGAQAKVWQDAGFFPFPSAQRGTREGAAREEGEVT